MIITYRLGKVLWIGFALIRPLQSVSQLVRKIPLERFILGYSKPAIFIATKFAEYPHVNIFGHLIVGPFTPSYVILHTFCSCKNDRFSICLGPIQSFTFLPGRGNYRMTIFFAIADIRKGIFLSILSILKP